MSEDFDPIGLLTEQYRVLNHAGLGFTEIRIPQKNVQIFVEGEDEFVRVASQYCKGPCYVGINPRRCKSGEAKDINYITAIVFDFDPVRPKDAPSTDAQHDEAIRIASDFCTSVEGILVDSGSGAHVYMPITSIPVVDPKFVADALRNFAKEVQKTYSTQTVRVDSTFDLPRIIRCWGTRNTKSNRDCKVLSGNTKRRDFRLSDYASKPDSVPAVAVATDNVKLRERFERAKQSSGRLRGILSRELVYGERAKADFAFGGELFRLGFSKEEVKALMPLNTAGKFLQRTSKDQDGEIERIYDKFKPEIPVSEKAMDVASYMADLETRTPGIMTGFARWDKMTAGLKGGRFYVDAGRPTEGKTTRLVQVAVNVATGGHKVLYFPTECTKSSIYDKMVSCGAEVNLRNFQFGTFSEDEKDRIKTVLPKIMALPIVVKENFNLDYKAIEEAVIAENPDYVIVDFLNRMTYKDVNSASELGANVMAIKNLGKYRNIPITLAAQLHRTLPGKGYSLSDLKGTGKLEEEGDIITFVHNITPGIEPSRCTATVLKNKFGEPGEIKMMFDRGICRFREVDIWPS